jgi:hypothetical protein
MLSSTETPIGVISWDGTLNEETKIVLPNGTKVPFYTLVSQTNGLIINWLKNDRGVTVE